MILECGKKRRGSDPNSWPIKLSRSPNILKFTSWKPPQEKQLWWNRVGTKHWFKNGTTIHQLKSYKTYSFTLPYSPFPTTPDRSLNLLFPPSPRKLQTLLPSRHKLKHANAFLICFVRIILSLCDCLSVNSGREE